MHSQRSTDSYPRPRPLLATAALVALALPLLAPAALSASAAAPDSSTALIGRAAPALVAGRWLNGASTTLAAQRGKVVALLFFTQGCINRRHNLPYWSAWARRHAYAAAGSGVAVNGAHAPGTPCVRSAALLRGYVRDQAVRFPIVADDRSADWSAYHVDSWPTTILIDKRGRVRATYAGELHWQGSGDYRKVGAEIAALRTEPVAG